ncbi:hypothetical protein ACLOJK_005123 [Asimina triloba]
MANLHSVADAVRADFEVKFGLEASVRHFSSQAGQAREEISRLLSKINILQAERDESIRKAATAEGIESPHCRDLGLDASEWSSLDRKALVIREQITELRCEGPELPKESRLLRAEVARLRAELEVLRT